MRKIQSGRSRRYFKEEDVDLSPDNVKQDQAPQPSQKQVDPIPQEAQAQPAQVSVPTPLIITGPDGQRGYFIPIQAQPGFYNPQMQYPKGMMVNPDPNAGNINPGISNIATAEDKEESALTINGKKSRIGLKDFNVLATSLHLNEKSLQAIYKRFNAILPQWKGFILQSFLSDEMKAKYIQLITDKFDALFFKV